MASYKLLLLAIPVVAVLFMDFSIAFAQESGQYVYGRIEIWSLFYRLMVIAFVIGAILMGVIFYVVYRFRESHPKNRNLPVRSSTEGEHH
ncbi:cytochrome c oxidase subunit II [Nitrososphaera viennensis]|uniref:Heme transporter CcmC n=2 Tax=Nitrososphaera viennensis TaxID=1034015 RepID=A0A977IDD0_9ARCH|nr:heme transporter CcmC [Nitrososphaera viennensis]AIC17029.1 putative heme/copper-type cytochrome/quinol oxidase, subunit [Nitrososphaera viennensis EN76]UVS68926.1 heme transporter CcmC [Nitrososphaera viennensis]